MKIGIIGAGNMGEAIIKGLLLKACFLNCSKIIVSDVSGGRLKYIKKRYKVRTTDCSEDLIKLADIIILAVKPQQIAGVLAEIGRFIDQRKLVISIAAGVKVKYIEKSFLSKVPVIRVMPNMPALVQKGVSTFCCGRYVKKADKKTAFNILSNIGEVIEVKESLMDVVTAISGSGPAYFFFLEEALIECAKKHGLGEMVARRLVAQTAFGASALVLETDESPKDLRQRVTSKGGTTEAAFKVFEQAKLKKIFENAVDAAVEKSKSLAAYGDTP